MNIDIGSAQLWILFGFFAQFVFFLRFLVQWLASERKKQSIIPVSFWYISIAGTILIMIYSIYRRDIVFITANALSLIIYIRNIILLQNAKPTEEVVGAEEVVGK